MHLLIAYPGVLDPSEEIDNSEGVKHREIIDSSLTTENIGIFSKLSEGRYLAYQKTAKLRKATITYDKKNNQSLVGFPWRVGEPPKYLTYTLVSEVNKVLQTSLRFFFYVQKTFSKHYYSVESFLMDNKLIENIS